MTKRRSRQPARGSGARLACAGLDIRGRRGRLASGCSRDPELGQLVASLCQFALQLAHQEAADRTHREGTGILSALRRRAGELDDRLILRVFLVGGFGPSQEGLGLRERFVGVRLFFQAAFLLPPAASTPDLDASSTALRA